jgi:Ca-activated chloride channel family protein
MKTTKKILPFLLIFTLILSACAQQPSTGDDKPISQKIDDWQFDPSKDYEERAVTSAPQAPMAAMDAMDVTSESASGNLGFSVGGAKDIENFRKNIENDYLPIPTDITYEGLFYDYFFDTGQKEECEKLFCPSYSTAVSSDPFSEKQEYYLSVGLNSGIKESDFQRKKLNLVIVLDISGSMGTAFNKYYYDRFGNQVELEEGEESTKTKMEIASKSVVALLDHLEDDDHFGMVLFDDQSYLAKPLSRVGDTDMKAIEDHILEINDHGGTNMEAGMKQATELFDELREVDPAEYENRIIFMTDAQPNTGDTSEEGLAGMTKKNSKNGIYTTFIGIGVDFNTELIELMTKIRGANYYSVHSEKQFTERMDEGFDYMVTPLVFDLELKLDADGYEIEKVFGSPEADEATGQIMYVNTLFPSKTEEGEVRGGLVLLKLKKTEENGKLELKVSYEDRSGNKEIDEKEITFNAIDKDNYDNTGIRKGILLSRYANLLKAWAMDGHVNHDRPDEDPIPCPIITYDEGCVIPEPPFIPPCFPYPELGQWERQSLLLTVSNHYKKLFEDFSKYFEDEMEAIGDEDLEQEMDILEELKKK